MVPKSKTEGLPTASKCKKAVMCPMEQIQVLDKLHSGTSYGAVCHELRVNESKTTVHKTSLNRNTQGQNKVL